MNLYIKRGDTREGVGAVIRKDGTPVDLTGCTVKFYMPPQVPEAFATVLDAAAGKVVFPLEDNAVDTLGAFQFEFKVFYPDGRVQTVPSKDRAVLTILPDLMERSDS